MATRAFKTLAPIPADVVASLAADLTAYRLGGCPSGGGAKVQQGVRKAAQKLGRSYGELWALVHAAAYAVIDSTGAADL